MLGTGLCVITPSSIEPCARVTATDPFVRGYADEMFGTEPLGRRFGHAYLVRAFAGVCRRSSAT